MERSHANLTCLTTTELVYTRHRQSFGRFVRRAFPELVLPSSAASIVMFGNFLGGLTVAPPTCWPA